MRQQQQKKKNIMPYIYNSITGFVNRMENINNSIKGFVIWAYDIMN